MVKIEYIGKKPLRSDTVAGTGAVWCGEGDVQSVPDDAAPKLLKHSDVWVLAKVTPIEAEKTPAVIDPSTSPAPVLLADGLANQQISPEAFITTPGGVTHALNVLDRAALHALAKELDVKVHHNAGADKVIEALQAAFPA